MSSRRQARRAREAVSASAASQGVGLDSGAKLNYEYMVNIDGILRNLRESLEENRRMQRRLEEHNRILVDFMNEEDLSTRRKPKRWYHSLR